jgi:DNA (cytosine-5)-methyltransferase 1
MIRILNLYAGIGGNRKLWDGDIEVTAIENNEEIAKIYQNFFPNDKVIVTDAHQYLLEHFKEFDFIWSSPPCPTHSVTNHFLNAQGIIRYPDMNLYQEIIFLNQFFKGKWVVENVKSYYSPLIRPFEIGRHYFWSNFNLTKIKQPKNEIGKMHGKRQKAHNKKIEERNMVNSELGNHIFKMAFKEKQEVLV